ncbi:hypothetical protein SELMODRAFT_268593 [Selaginella moellendorffii]|uniref:Aminotransferase class I/classII large domain-containing protein n=1 Tax=Selaginella moellendorffii TaxID=88036 RepID=D8SGP0_SELML|nr:hypothetical protein SELMODRAFT_268593 [Selaginella moellendorffii]
MAGFSRRILATDTPVMVQVQELLQGRNDVVSLAQGVVHWQPPPQALEKVKDLIQEISTSRYGPDDGLPELRLALSEKLKKENKLFKSSVMVTAGANQAYANLALSLCDPGDSVVMFAPYYFNAYTTFQMTGIYDIVVVPSHPGTCHPDPGTSASFSDDSLRTFTTEMLEEALREHTPKPRIVNVVNPGNPSGTYLPEETLKRISELCKNAGVWLVVDNTYEYFMYDGRKHVCIEGDHILNVFSFSKAYGMMGWRIGYIAYPSTVPGFGEQLLKVQDNVPICASIIGQKLALAALDAGPQWVLERVARLGKNRAMVLDALSPLGQGAVKGGEGAIYFWAKLPEKFPDDVAVVKWLVSKHKVMVVPGSASGGKGCIRISYGGLDEGSCEIAAARLKAGLEELVLRGCV